MVSEGMEKDELKGWGEALAAGVEPLPPPPPCFTYLILIPWKSFVQVYSPLPLVTKHSFPSNLFFGKFFFPLHIKTTPWGYVGRGELSEWRVWIAIIISNGEVEKSQSVDSSKGFRKV